MVSFRMPADLRARLEATAKKHGREKTETLCALLDQAMALDEELSAPRVKKALERFMAERGLTASRAIARLVQKALDE